MPREGQEVTPGTSQQKGSTPVVRGLQDGLKKLSDKQFDNLLKTGSYKCYWNRVFLTGKFAVGKTTLAKILVGDEAPIERESTDGIWIYLGRAGMNIKERIWIFLEKGTVLNATVQSLLRSEEITNPGAMKPSEELLNPCAANPSVSFPYEIKKKSKLKAFLHLPNRIYKVFKGKKTTSIKTPVDSSTNMEGTSRKDSPKTIEISDDDIIKLVRSECMKGNYEMTIVPIDLWDFGGQKIYHMTHQLFITSRGTFVLIFNGGERIHEEDGAYLVHWVNCVLTYCTTLKENEEFPQILFVATHKDQVKGDIEEQRHSLENSIEILFQNHGGKKHLKYRPLIFVDARNKDDKDIDVLKKQLVEVALDHPRCGELMPTKFVPLELQLAQKGEDKQKIVTIEELKDMNNQNENMALDNDELKLFLKVNHALGKLIYFDEACLRNKVIIDPPFLVDVLRSIVTEEQFWPQHLLHIFKALKDSGKLLKKDLYEIWEQECFQTILEHKEYMVEMLVHLDIICRQKDDTNGIDNFLIPCMISTKREDNLDIPFDRSIHLAYTFRDEVVPPAILYKFIATFITIWKLQISKNSSLMLFTDSADVSIDKEHDMRFDIQRNKLIITLSHKTRQTSVVSTIASTAQECLTHAITQISNFYFSVTEDTACTIDLPFTIQIGIVCGTDLCFFDHKLSSKCEWTCPDHKRKHKTDIVSRWFADKLPAREDRCHELCPGLDKAWLDSQLDDKRLGRLAVKLTKEETQEIYMCLKEREPDQSWKNLESNTKEQFALKINALHDWKKSTRHATFNKLQDSMRKKNIDLHKLCQILRDVQIDPDLPTDKLKLRPSSSDIEILPDHIGKETFQLGIELGLSVVEMHQIQSNHVTNLRSQTENVLDKWLKHHQATNEVLVKTLFRLDLSGVLGHLTYEVGVKERLEDRIRSNIDEILENIPISDILDHMMTYIVISADDRRRIEEPAGQDDQKKALLEIVMKRRERAYVVFVEALKDNADLANKMKHDLEDQSLISKLALVEYKGLSVCTDQPYKVRLQKNYSEIICNIKHENIVDHLITSDVLSVDEKEKIEKGLSQKEKNRQIIDLLLHKSEKGYTEFLQALQDDPSYNELADQIDKTDITDGDMSAFQSCNPST
ncbi:uncharacterized protein LOC127701421 [Mytilus californianus]|uniref:uncharacterized protein LOC127701421 n=1 Tax=Mytilus californianus TaxID=6549 RepID=UPI002247906E|nr:uncharacterized protein LOC127701421 [Mytilus californianus]